MTNPESSAHRANTWGRCSTCADEVSAVEIVAVDALGLKAEALRGSQRLEIDISLLGEVAVGEVVLVHGGVALDRAARPPG